MELFFIALMAILVCFALIDVIIVVVALALVGIATIWMLFCEGIKELILAIRKGFKD